MNQRIEQIEGTYYDTIEKLQDKIEADYGFRPRASAVEAFFEGYCTWDSSMYETIRYVNNIDDSVTDEEIYDEYIRSEEYMVIRDPDDHIYFFSGEIWG